MEPKDAVRNHDPVTPHSPGSVGSGPSPDQASFDATVDREILGGLTSSAPTDKNRRQEVRPVLVVGVGGTGCLAVQHVKKRIHELTGGEDVPFLRTMVFDTTIADESLMRFDEGDFVNIGQLDFSSIVKNIDRYEHLKSWFPSDRLKPLQIGLGAMGVRHIGRLCYFQWRESSDVRERLMKRIRDLKNPAIQNRMKDFGRLAGLTVDLSSGIDIHVVGSGSGGTGSGLFLDIAYDLRILAKEATGTARVIGHFVLPDAFEGLVPDPIMPQIENNSHALLSEIDHFMHEGGWKVDYKGGTVESDEPPFDLIYLLSRNGMDGAVRTRNELLSMIGAAVATLTMTPLGKHIMDSAVNLVPSILSGTDPLKGRPCPYASYGISIGTLDREELARQGVGVVSQRILDQLVKVTDDDETAQTSELIDSFSSEAQLTMDDLDRLRPEVPTLHAQGATPREAELFRRGAHTRDIRELVDDVVVRISPTVAARFEAAGTENLLSHARRMFTIPTARTDGTKRASSLQDVAAFVRALTERMEDIAQYCDRFVGDLAREAQSAERKVRALIASPPATDNWLENYTELVRKTDQKAVWTRFYTDIRENAMSVRTTLQRFSERVEALHDSLGLLRDRVQSHIEEAEEPDAPRFQLATSERLLDDSLKDIHLPERAFRSVIGDLFAKASSDPAVHLEPLGTGLRSIAKRFVRDALSTQDQQDSHAAFQNLDRSYFENRLRWMRHLSQPGIRCLEQYPRERIVTVGYASGSQKGTVARTLPNIDGTIQVVPDPHEDLTCMRFVYGFPLWAILGVQKWEETAIAVQTSEGTTNNFLDPLWTEHIHPLIPKSDEYCEDIWLFSMYCCSRRITKEGFTYQLYGTRLDGIRDRAAMFTEFRECLSSGRITRERAHREVEEFLTANRDDAGVLQILRDYLTILQKRLQKSTVNRVPHEEIVLLRDEIPVIREKISLKEVDIELDSGETLVSGSPNLRQQDLWLLAVMSASGHLERHGDSVLFHNHRLGVVHRRTELLGALRKCFEDGVLSRENASSLVQDFLIAGPDEKTPIEALRSHARTLKTAMAGMQSDEDRETAAEEIEAVESYLTKRTHVASNAPVREEDL